MFRFYKTILNLKTRLQEQNLCKTKLKIKYKFYRMRLFYRMNFFCRVKFFLTELNFLKGDTNIYFKQITVFRKKDFVEIIHIFFLKI